MDLVKQHCLRVSLRIRRRVRMGRGREAQQRQAIEEGGNHPDVRLLCWYDYPCSER